MSSATIQLAKVARGKTPHAVSPLRRKIATTTHRCVASSPSFNRHQNRPLGHNQGLPDTIVVFDLNVDLQAGFTQPPSAHNSTGHSYYPSRIVRLFSHSLWRPQGIESSSLIRVGLLNPFANSSSWDSNPDNRSYSNFSSAVALCPKRSTNVEARSSGN